MVFGDCKRTKVETVVRREPFECCNQIGGCKFLFCRNPERIQFCGKRYAAEMAKRAEAEDMKAESLAPEEVLLPDSEDEFMPATVRYQSTILPWSNIFHGIL